MTQEEKELLLKAICGYLPYGLIYHRNDGANIKLEEIDVVRRLFNYTDCPEERDIKPYLRPMSSMTEEEYKEYDRLIRMSVTVAIPPGASIMKPEYIVDLEDDGDGLNHLYDWLNKNHFDYRGLIPMGLALEAPEDMYKTE